MSRRQAVNKTKLFVRLFFNGKEVCQSSARSLNKNFVVTFAQIFPIQIVQLPEVLTLQVNGIFIIILLSDLVILLCSMIKDNRGQHTQNNNFGRSDLATLRGSCGS